MKPLCILSENINNFALFHAAFPYDLFNIVKIYLCAEKRMFSFLDIIIFEMLNVKMRLYNVKGILKQILFKTIFFYKKIPLN